MSEITIPISELEQKRDEIRKEWEKVGKSERLSAQWWLLNELIENTKKGEQNDG